MMTKEDVIGLGSAFLMVLLVLGTFHWFLQKPQTDFANAVAEFLKVEEDCNEVWQVGSSSFYCLYGNNGVREFMFSYYSVSIDNIKKKYDCDKKRHHRFVELEPNKTICYDAMARFEDNRG